MSEFTARLYRVGPPPDADGDIITSGAIADGAKARVSLDGHDTLLHPELDPAGEAVLKHRGDSVIAEGTTFDTPRGRALRSKLREGGGRQEWSVGYKVLETRDLTSEHRKNWPDVARIITRWDVVEISPVGRGSCGPSCRTLSAKEGMKCLCGCRSAAAVASERAAIDRAIAEAEQLMADIKAGRPPGLEEIAAFLLEPHVVKLAEDAAEAAAQDLGLDHSVRVRWYAQKSRPRASGFVTPFDDRTIWISARAQGQELLRLVGHEVKHLAQNARGDVLDEAEAWKYGERLACSDRRYWPIEVGARIYDR